MPAASVDINTVKCVVIGDGAVGKVLCSLKRCNHILCRRAFLSRMPRESFLVITSRRYWSSKVLLIERNHVS